MAHHALLAQGQLAYGYKEAESTPEEETIEIGFDPVYVKVWALDGASSKVYEWFPALDDGYAFEQDDGGSTDVKDDDGITVESRKIKIGTACQIGGETFAWLAMG